MTTMVASRGGHVVHASPGHHLCDHARPRLCLKGSLVIVGDPSVGKTRLAQAMVSEEVQCHGTADNPLSIATLVDSQKQQAPAYVPTKASRLAGTSRVAILQKQPLLIGGSASAEGTTAGTVGRRKYTAHKSDDDGNNATPVKFPEAQRRTASVQVDLFIVDCACDVFSQDRTVASVCRDQSDVVLILVDEGEPDALERLQYWVKLANVGVGKEMFVATIRKAEREKGPLHKKLAEFADANNAHFAVLETEKSLLGFTLHSTRQMLAAIGEAYVDAYYTALRGNSP
eukprot:GHVU01021405.1.p1 GENE.GHVU01021405.1~~GHVU01021405.1.p1  ORF type:complete len:286 (-),score=40.60 GHVU01021405.1:1096-1953(-)